jgi:hypothetical protein
MDDIIKRYKSLSFQLDEANKAIRSLERMRRKVFPFTREIQRKLDLSKQIKSDIIYDLNHFADSLNLTQLCPILNERYDH